MDGHVLPREDSENADAPRGSAARRDDNIRAFSSGPGRFWTIESTPAGTLVTVSDMRFADETGLAASTILAAQG